MRKPGGKACATFCQQQPDKNISNYNIVVCDSWTKRDPAIRMTITVKMAHRHTDIKIMSLLLPQVTFCVVLKVVVIHIENNLIFLDWGSTILISNSFFIVPECTSSTIIRDATRRISYGKAAKCDDGIVKKWYRFHLPGENIRMPESCTTVNKCGTHGTGWLSGKHPSVNEGIVFRTVCFSWSGNCCLNNIPIRVRNCGSFFIYELKSTSGWCSRRYCTT